MLDDNNQNSRIDVDVLVRVLNNTINFENNLHTYLVNEFEGFNQNLKNTIGGGNKNVLSLKGMETQKKRSDKDGKIDFNVYYFILIFII